MIGLRLQGGPCDGSRASNAELFLDEWTDTDRLWARPCPLHGGDYSLGPIEGWEVYERNEEDRRGWLIYVWVDPNLDVPDELAELAEEVAAGFAMASTLDLEAVGSHPRPCA